MKKHGIILLLLLIASCVGLPQMTQAKASFRILSFNLWVGGDGSGFTKAESVDRQLYTIRSTKADIVAFQEQTSFKFGEHSRAKLLADSLGWQCLEIDRSRAVISRFPLERLKDAQSQVFKISIDGKTLIVADVHLTPYPYEPYEIAEGKMKTAEEVVASSIKSRGHQIQRVLDEIKDYPKTATLVLGDFNEPSYFDWTAKAIQDRKDARLTFPVQWPSSYTLVEKGFYDAFRKIHKNVLKKPAYTWTSIPGGSVPNEVYDRIDLIFANKFLKVKTANIVGEKGKDTDIAVDRWPTDHRVVCMDFTF